MINAVIVEDSRLARNELKRLLKAHPQVNIQDEAENVGQALEKIDKHQPDLLFLDIDMPGQNGFDLLEQLDRVPLVIFTTAFNEFALKAFEFNTLDYLLKPVNPERLAGAIKKVENHLGEQSQTAELPLSEQQRIFIKDGDEHHLVTIADIRMLESCGNYTKVFFDRFHPLTHRALGKIEARLDDKLFFRANRQQIVNLKYIKTVEPWFNGQLQVVLTDGQEVTISRRHASRFRQLFSL